MPRNYEQKTVKSYTDKTLAKCINAFENGKMSFCKASKYFQVCFVKFFLHLAYGRNRVEPKVHHSKPSVSAMFAGSAEGTYLPSLIVYKSQKIYPEWVHRGPNNTVYSHTRSGWFDSTTFETLKQLVPSTQGLEGPIALIGDNLGSHCSLSIPKYCNIHNIRFICLPPNSTHLCQPLDVAVFRPAKTEQKDILDTWRRKSWCSDNLPKTIFPSLLGKLVNCLKSTNLVSGFGTSGLWSWDRNQVLKRLPSCNDTSNVNEFFFNKLVLKVLKENCGVGSPKRCAKERGRKVEPGQQITSDIFLSDDKNEEP